MGGVTPETLLSGSILVDFEELYQTTEKFAKIINAGKRVHITSKAGTDLSFSIEGRKCLSLNGRIDEVSNSVGIPSGEAATSPVEGTAEGIAIIDGGMHEIGLITEPIVMKVEKGFVTKISGGAEAEQLHELLETSGDENSYNIGEFAFGTNSSSSVAHNIQEYKNKLGTIHLALGNNLNLFGHTQSKTHLDAIMMKPTVIIDNKVILEEGVPLI
jgi:leucyl aminopeptidase (aminopeptidase T)